MTIIKAQLSSAELEARCEEASIRLARGIFGDEAARSQNATKFELVVNLKTAKALRLTIPESFLSLADELIDFAMRQLRWRRPPVGKSFLVVRQTDRCGHLSGLFARCIDRWRSAVSMAWMMFLDVARNPKSSRRDEEVRRGLTLSKRGAHIADLMLFDQSSLAEAHCGRKTYRILLSERTRAVERFRRRLPRVLEALSWHPVTTDTLPRFGKFFERIDWPYVLLETGEYRMNFADPEYYMTSEEFDRMLEFAVSAIDDQAMAVLGNPFGGEGRYSPPSENCWNSAFSLRN